MPRLLHIERRSRMAPPLGAHSSVMLPTDSHESRTVSQMGTDARGRGDAVYEQLRKHIVLGRLVPRELLVEADLAQDLQVSRTPVREALQRLADEGLVDNFRRRWMVHQHTPEEIQHIYEVRAALESYSARLASLRATGEEIHALESLLASRPLALDHGDAAMVEDNERFHHMLVAAGHNPHLAELVERSRRYYFNLQTADLYRQSDISASQGEHAALLDAVKNRDADSAERLAREHVEGALGLILRGRQTAARDMR